MKNEADLFPETVKDWKECGQSGDLRQSRPPKQLSKVRIQLGNYLLP